MIALRCSQMLIFSLTVKVDKIHEASLPGILKITPSLLHLHRLFPKGIAMRASGNTSHVYFGTKLLSIKSTPAGNQDVLLTRPISEAWYFWTCGNSKWVFCLGFCVVG